MNFFDAKPDHLKKILNQAQKAWQSIVPYWPLHTAVSVNPVEFYTDAHFDDVFFSLEHDRFVFLKNKTIFEMINRQTIKWMSLFFDLGQAKIGLKKNETMYQTLLEYWLYDPEIHQNQILKKQKILDFLSLADPLQAIEQCLKAYPSKSYERIMFLVLGSLSGWSGYVKYYILYQKTDSHYDLEYLALRLILIQLFDYHLEELESAKERDPSCHLGSSESVLIDHIKNQEQIYQKELFAVIGAQADSDWQTFHIDLQAVFCIDVRSEVLRRYLEEYHNYETFGCSGFFGLPIGVKNRFEIFQPYCPVILKPAHTLRLMGLQSFTIQVYDLCKRSYEKMKYHPLAAFCLAEFLGMIFFLWTLVKNFFPKRSYEFREMFESQFIDNPEEIRDQIAQNIPHNQCVDYAYNFLKSVDLKNHFAPVILLCGHYSVTDNNAHSHFLQCGACAGQHGSLNAHIMAEILNHPQIRLTLLSQYDLEIPQKTIFIAAQHNTASDALEYRIGENLSQMHQKILNQLKKDLDRIQKTLLIKKTSLESFAHAQKKVFLDMYSWSRIRSEWGLARNASFIIGPRFLTRSANLEGRSFLHSYNPKEDLDGSLLESILNGPVVVAYFINMQYFFSTYDDARFGAQTKILHNPTSQIGVMQGNSSDLLVGLPFESVFITEGQPYHPLLRLCVIVYAHKKIIEGLLYRNSYLKTLVDHEWLLLFLIDPDTKKIQKYSPSSEATSSGFFEKN